MPASSARKGSCPSAATHPTARGGRKPGSSSNALRATPSPSSPSWKSWGAPAQDRLLYVGRRDGDRLLYAGKAGTGYTEKVARELREKLDPLIVKKSPLSVPVKKPKATWVQPIVDAEIEYGDAAARSDRSWPLHDLIGAGETEGAHLPRLSAQRTRHDGDRRLFAARARRISPRGAGDVGAGGARHPRGCVYDRAAPQVSLAQKNVSRSREWTRSRPIRTAAGSFTATSR
jgi:hypothetical protein